MVELEKNILVPIKDLKEDNCRKDYGDIKGLAENIKSVGQLFPIRIDNDNTISDGHRRKRALEMLGRTHAWCVRSAWTAEQCRVVQLSAEQHTLKFTNAERDIAWTDLAKAHKGPTAQLARSLGVDEAYFSNVIKRTELGLPEEIFNAVSPSNIDETAGLDVNVRRDIYVAGARFNWARQEYRDLAYMLRNNKLDPKVLKELFRGNVSFADVREIAKLSIDAQEKHLRTALSLNEIKDQLVCGKEVKKKEPQKAAFLEAVNQLTRVLYDAIGATTRITRTCAMIEEAQRNGAKYPAPLQKRVKEILDEGQKSMEEAVKVIQKTRNVM